jgi:hypothetical protein
MRRTRWALLAALVVVVSGIGLAPEVQADLASPWPVIALQPVGPGWQSHASDINNAGTTVGWSTAPVAPPSPGPGTPFAVKWSAGGTPTLLPLPNGCFWSRANAIDEPGVIAGIASCTGGFKSIEWLPDGALLMSERASPSDIDDNGISVGVRSSTDNVTYHAYAEWPPYGLIPLPDAGYRNSVASALTSFGYIVGTAYPDPADTSRPGSVALGWNGNSVYPLTSIDWATQGIDVNSSGYALVEVDNPNAASGVLVAPGGRTSAVGHVSQHDLMIDLNNAFVVLGRGSVQNGGVGDPWAGALYVRGVGIRIDELVNAASRTTWGRFGDPAALNVNAWVVGNTQDGRAWHLEPPGVTTTG